MGLIYKCREKFRKMLEISKKNLKIAGKFVKKIPMVNKKFT